MKMYLTLDLTILFIFLEFVFFIMLHNIKQN